MLQNVSLICLLFISTCYCSGFSPVTSRIFSTNENDILAAFGDFNADKLTDIFVINHAGQKVDVLLQSENSRYHRQPLVDITGSMDIFTGLMLGDFNGDVTMDMLLTKQPVGAAELTVNVSIYFGTITHSVGEPFDFPKPFRDQPLVFDYNGDMISDLLAEHVSGGCVVYLGNGVNFTEVNTPFEREPAPFLKPHSNAFVDLNGDRDADLLLTTEEGFQQFEKKDGKFQWTKTYNLPPNLAYVGQSTFADFDQDDKPDHLVPVCKENNTGVCEGSALYIYSTSKNKWFVMNEDFKFSTPNQTERSWQFVLPKSEPLGSYTNYSLPAVVRVGDFNIDGFPDILVVMASKDVHNVWHQQAFLLPNVGCEEGPDCTYGRRFGLTNAWISSFDHVLMTAFFDLYEDGTLDILLVGMSPGLGETVEKPQLIALASSLAEDACFIKVLCVSGRCSGSNCAEGTKPYGVNIPGPTFYYSTTRIDGSVQKSQVTQLTQSAHFPLQLPFNIFGLGPTPNFVEKLGVGIPSKSKKKLTSEWTEIIPNSQLIVIPNPISEPSSWTLKLFVTPSELVYYTGTALVGTCGLLAVIVGVLHWKEKREDLEEKKQEAQKFHFDAM